LNDSEEVWRKLLSDYTFSGISEYRCADFEELKAKWVITKVHRTIVLGENGSISNAFTNVFELNFLDELK
jgi:hypothetical protein